MEWTYSYYVAVSYGIPIGLVILICFGVFIIFFSSKKGKEFVTERIIGVDPSKAEDDDENNSKKKDNEGQESSEPSKNSTLCLSIFFCILAVMTLSVTAVLIFQGCFLSNTRLLPDDSCPEYPMDCFVFNETKSQPISENITFHCDPKNKTQFPSGVSDPTAWCFGWIIQLQTTKNVLDQLGVCTGLLGLFSTFLAVIVYLGRSIKTLILCFIFIGSCVAATILLVFFKWSYTPLTYAVLALIIGLGIFGLVLFCILPKKKKSTDIEQKLVQDTNEADVSSKSITYPPISPLPTSTSSNRTKVFQRSAKVTPK